MLLVNQVVGNVVGDFKQISSSNDSTILTKIWSIQKFGINKFLALLLGTEPVLSSNVRNSVGEQVFGVNKFLAPLSRTEQVFGSHVKNQSTTFICNIIALVSIQAVNFEVY